LRHGGAEVVAQDLGRLEEGRVDDAADGMDAVVLGAGLAAAGAIKAGHGLAAANVEGLAENVFAAVSDGFDGGHGTRSLRVQYPTFHARSCDVVEDVHTSTVVRFLQDGLGYPETDSDAAGVDGEGGVFRGITGPIELSFPCLRFLPIWRKRSS
jgi:hypothetical protein